MLTIVNKVFNLLQMIDLRARLARHDSALIGWLLVVLWLLVACTVWWFRGGTFFSAAGWTLLFTPPAIIIAVVVLSYGDWREGLAGVVGLIALWTLLYYAGCDLSSGAPPGCC